MLPDIPSKRYFSIGEVAQLCQLKTHVLRYWEREFKQIKLIKRLGNRRYYRRDDILMICEIKELLYSQGFTLSGARLQLKRRAPDSLSSVEPSALLFSLKEDLLALRKTISQTVNNGA